MDNSDYLKTNLIGGRRKNKTLETRNSNIILRSKQLVNTSIRSEDRKLIRWNVSPWDICNISFCCKQYVASAQSETVSISPLTVEVALCLNWIDKCIVTTNFIYCYGTVRSTYKGKKLMWKADLHSADASVRWSCSRTENKAVTTIGP